MRICFRLGFRTIYLVGCDFEMRQSNCYWFDEQRSSLGVERNNEAYIKITKYLSWLKPLIEERGARIYNTNSKSHLEIFDFMNLQIAVATHAIELQTVEPSGAGVIPGSILDAKPA